MWGGVENAYLNLIALPLSILIIFAESIVAISKQDTKQEYGHVREVYINFNTFILFNFI